DGAAAARGAFLSIPPALDAALAGLQGADNIAFGAGYGSGTSYVDGVTHGIHDQGYATVQAARDLADQLSLGFNYALGITSPSRVMMRSGREFVRGAALGI